VPLKAKGNGQVRIISGQWRGRKLTVPELEGLRPTPDRVRETLFNWIGPQCRSATVLDLFCGSGALGFEAASRGASTVYLVDQNQRVIQALQQQAQAWGVHNVQFYAHGAENFLNQPALAYDLIFLDPPYAQADLRSLLWQHPNWGDMHHQETLIYTEWPRQQTPPEPPPGFEVRKHKRAASVEFILWGALRPQAAGKVSD